jgi:hypothetical protein
VASIKLTVTDPFEPPSNPDWLRPVCILLLTEMVKRIHEQGLASDGNKIGTYSNSYLKLREAKYKIPKGETDVVLYLTSKLQNSWIVFGTDNGYAVGFTDEGAGVTSLKKITFAEQHFNKLIGSPTKEELDMVIEWLNQPDIWKV